jgi:hypothetical protein
MIDTPHSERQISEDNMRFNPALNLHAFSFQSPAAAPPAINAIYLRDGKYDNNMKRADVASTFEAFRAQTAASRLALFFHGGLVDKAWGQQGAANQYENYKDVVFPLFFIWESGFWEVLAHHFPLIFAETIFGRIVDHNTWKILSPFAALPVSGICEYSEGQGGSGPHEFDGDDMPILGMDRFFAQTGVFSAADYPSGGAGPRPIRRCSASGSHKICPGSFSYRPQPR